MKNSLKLGLVVSLALLLANQAHADLKPVPSVDPVNLPPPSGAILDLNGQPLPTSYTQYTATFTATGTTTNISFALRDDPGYLSLDNVTLQNNTTSSPVSVVNGGFESGPVGSNTPTGWTYLNSFGASFAGVVADASTAVGGALPYAGNNFYQDGATQAYDGITQAISTTVGDSYTISFRLNQVNVNGIGTVFSDLSTNGNNTADGGTLGNGIDVLVYAGAIPVSAVPEPSSLVYAIGIPAIGILILAARRRRRRAMV
jgi:hypothetical protein